MVTILETVLSKATISTEKSFIKPPKASDILFFEKLCLELYSKYKLSKESVEFILEEQIKKEIFLKSNEAKIHTYISGREYNLDFLKLRKNVQNASEKETEQNYEKVGNLEEESALYKLYTAEIQKQFQNLEQKEKDLKYLNLRCDLNSNSFEKGTIAIASNNRLLSLKKEANSVELTIGKTIGRINANILDLEKIVQKEKPNASPNHDSNTQSSVLKKLEKAYNKACEDLKIQSKPLTLKEKNKLMEDYKNSATLNPIYLENNLKGMYGQTLILKSYTEKITLAKDIAIVETALTRRLEVNGL